MLVAVTADGYTMTFGEHDQIGPWMVARNYSSADIYLWREDADGKFLRTKGRWEAGNYSPPPIKGYDLMVGL
jgi:hypothetical protein